MKKILFTLCCLLGIIGSQAQTTTTISSGTNVVNVGAAYNVPYGFFVNNGTYTDTTSPGSFNCAGGVAFQGTGTTAVFNLNLNSGTGSDDMTAAQVSVYNTATLASGVSLDAGAGNLFLRTDIGGHYNTANLVNNGLLTGTVNGLVTYATATSGTCPSYSSTLSLNISGTSMVYQWQSSPDNATWTTITGATNATYTATVNALVYYQCVLSTNNTAYSQTTPSVSLAAATGGLSVSAGPNVSVATGGSTTLTASGATTYTWAPATGLSATTGASVTFTAGSTTTYMVTGLAGVCTGSATVTATVVSYPGGPGSLVLNVGAGANWINKGAQVTMDAGWVMNNGAYEDSTSPGAFNSTSGTEFSGANNIDIYNLNFNTSGSSQLLDQVSIRNTATVNAGTSLDANGQLWIRSDLYPATANLVVNGIITNGVLGIIAKASPTSGVSGFTSTVSCNISGTVMQYQWQSSPDNATWANVSGATNATYIATVTAIVYYRVNTNTTNSSFTNSSASVLLSPGTIPSFDGGSPQSLTVCENSSSNSINSLLTVTDPGVGATETYSVTAGPSHGSVTVGSTVTSGTSVSPTGWSYTPTGGYSGTDAFTVQVNNGSNTATTVINVTINPVPVMSVSPTAQTVCNNANTSTEIFSSNLGVTTYTWTNNNTTIGIGASGSGSSIASFTATNTGSAPTSGVFTVTPQTVSCVGAAQTFTITVNPSPTAVFTVSPNPVCSGSPTTFTSVTTLCSGDDLLFNGTSSSATGSNVPTSVTNFTIEGWVNWNGGGGSNYQFIAANGGSGGYGLFYNNSYSTVGPVVGLNEPGGSLIYIPLALAVNTWTHLAITWNSGTIAIYLNGNFYGGGSGFGNPNPIAGGLYVGSFGAGHYFNGAIDEVKIWSTTLTGTQVSADAGACYTPPQAGLGGYWPFSEGAGTTTADASGNGHTLTLSNTTWATSTNPLSTYQWGFGDGSTSTGGSVAHTYTTSGAFTPTLTVTSGAGCTATATQVVTVNPLPVMTVTPTFQQVCNTLPTTAEVFTSSLGGTAYAWVNSNPSIGVAGSGSGSSIGSFSATNGGSTPISGIFTVTPTVTATGCIGPVQTFTITVNPTPVVTFTVQPGATGCESTNLTYGTQSGMTNYLWGYSGTLGIDYGVVSGGTTSSNISTVQYFTAGPQTVTINYTDANGCTAASPTSSTPTTIQLAPTVTSLSSTSGIPGNSVTITGTNFNATSANDIVYFGSVAASVTSASTTSLTATIPNSAVYYPVMSVENNSCALLGWAPYSFLPTYNNAGFVANTVNFDPKVDFTIGSSASHLGYGDVDGDGKTDIIITNSGTGTVSVYRNTSTSGSVSFASAVTVATGLLFPGYPVMGDLDGDGKLDLVFMSANAPAQVNIYLNTSTVGSISFASVFSIPYVTNANASVLADIDGDGKLDIIGNELGNLSVFRNTSTVGSLSFASGVTFTSPGGASINYIAAGDIDGDKKPDILISTANTTTSLSVWRNTSIPGTISMAARQDFTTAGYGNYVGIADIDGDGKADVLTINQGAGTWSLFPNTSTSGSISLGTRSDFTVGANPSTISIGDFDGDSKPDVVASSISASTVYVFRNTSSIGSFSFAQSVPFSSGAGSSYLAAVDIDGDGKSDIAVANQSTTTMSIFRNDPLQPVTGPNQVCAGGSTLTTITLADATPSGTWSSSDVTKATVGSTTGVVTGIAAGVVTITYAGTSAGGPNLGNYTTYQVTVNPLPTPTFTASAGATTCEGASVTYTTQTAQSNYIWTVSGTLGVDYAIIAGGTGTGNNSVTLQWYTSGSKTVTVNYTSPFGCSNGTAATNTTTIQMAPAVTSLSATSGIPGNSVTITGTNFNATSANDIVYFGSVAASVTSASTTSLTATIPKSSVYYPVISVENNSCALLGWAPYPFLPTFNNAGFVANTINFDPIVNFTVGSSPNEIGYGDVDGDGKTDLIVNNSGTGTISVYRNTSTSGSVSFASPVTVASGLLFPGPPSMGDLDGDGKLDLVFMVASGLPSGAVRVYLNTSTVGSVSFAAPVTLPYVVNANASVLADIDGDGRLDIIGNESSTMSVFRNTSTVGSLSFAARVDFAAPASINRIAVGDMDGDKKPDLLLSTSGGTASLSIFRNTSIPGTISFAARQDFTTPAGFGNYVALADIDGDGKQDVLTINQSAGTWSLFPNTSTSGSISLATRSDFTVGPNAADLFIADFDGDGKPDVATTSISASDVPVFRNTSTVGSFSFAPSVTFASGSGAASLAAFDVDGDGKADMAVLNQSTTTMSIFRNDPLQPVTGPNQVCAGGSTLTTITLADATPNGTWSSSDVTKATVGSTTGVVTGIAAGVVTITYAGTSAAGPNLGNYATYQITVNPLPTPTFTTFPGVNTCGGVAVTYTTQTSESNYIWSVPGTPGTDYVVTGGGTGTGNNSVTLEWFTSGSKTVTVNYTDPNTCTNLTPASNTTTVLAAPAITSVSPLLGFPASTVTINGSNFNATTTNNIVYFGATAATVTVASTSSLTVTVPTDATFNPVTVNNNTCALQGYAPKPFLPDYNNAPYVYGLVNFDPNVNVTVGSNPVSVAVGDFDGDGKADLAIANFGGSNVYVYRNISTSGTLTPGSFSGPVVITTRAGQTPSSVAVADLDGDGKLDIAVADRSGFVSVVRNTSPGVGFISFGARTDFAVGSNDWDVKIADIDKDGHPDLVVSNFSSNNISVLRNTATTGVLNAGSFAAQVPFSTGAGSGPFEIAIADIDGDGKPDVIVPNRSLNTIGILRNTSSVGVINAGSLAGIVTYPAGSGPFAIAIGDINGDGKPDVVVSNNSTTTISVFKNTATSGVINAGSLAAKVDFTVGTTPETIAIGDIDGDGKLDVVVPNSGSATVSVLRNTTAFGVISFAPKVDFSTGGGINPAWVAVADLDGDSKPDLAVASSGTTLTLLRNDPLAPITGATTVCAGFNITLSEATPNGTWVSSSSAIATVGSSSGVVTGVSSGVVTISYVGTAAGLFAGNITTYTVTVNATAANPTNNSPACVGGLVNLTSNPVGSGPFTYTWHGPAGYTSTLANPGISGIALSGGGTYSVTVTNTITGCAIVATTIVTVNPLPTTAPTNTSPVCVGGTVNFNAVATGVGTITYSWTGPSGFASPSATPSIVGVTFANAGIYICNVTTPGSGCTATSITTVTINPTPAAAPTNSSPVCTGGLVTLYANPSGGVTGYSWTGPAGFTSTVANPALIPPTGTNTYSLTVTSGPGSGCSPVAFATTIVTVNALPASITGTLNVCVTQTTTLSTASSGGTWSSSNTALATVGTGGVVTGVSAGTPYITYMFPSGCYVVAQVTVNPLPSAISGTFAICNGTSTTLGNTVSGGTWSSSNTGVATIGTSSGVVASVGPGNTTITYSLSSGCSATATFTVNANPTAITGSPVACVGSSIAALGSTPAGGTWTSSNTGMATIGTSSGIMTGVATGNPIISYTLSTGCYVTTTASVNASPAGITGTGAICVGNTLTLSDASAGGSWTSLSPGVASVGTSSGVVTGLANGLATIVYSMPGGCSTSATVTVNGLPTTITGTLSGCVGFTSSLSSTPIGGTWSSSDVLMATIGSSSGNVTTISAGNPVITYSTGAGCITTTTLTINPNSAAITGTLTVCAGSSTPLSDATPGGTWTSGSLGTATVGSTGLVHGVTAGNATIFYNLSTGCGTSVIVTVNATPTVITGTLSGCVGYTTTLNSTPAGGTWTSSDLSEATIGSSSGAVATLSAGNPVITYALSTGCSTNTLLTINAVPAAIVGSNTVCLGSSTSLTDATFGGTWSSLSSVIASVGSGTGVVTGASAGNTTISYTLSNGCSATSPMTVNALPTTITGTLNVCVGLTTTVNSTPAGGTWTSSNTLVATIGTSTGVITGVAAGTATITYTLGTGCITTAVVTVNPNPSANTGATAVCVGLTATLSNPAGGCGWTSSNTLVATVNACTGVWTGVSAATAVITYTSSTGCIATTPVTVNSNPTAITGTMNICAGLTTTLNSTPAGGTWTSSNVGLATVGSSSGVVTGVSAGNPTISYTLSTGCYAIAVATVNPLPAAITGLNNVCTGFTIVLSDASAGGNWTSSAPTIASIGSTTGVVSGLTAGNATITYTLPTGCTTTYAITVNPNPTAITGTMTVCVGLTTTLNSTPAGGTWSSSDVTMATVAGNVVTGVSAGTPTISYTLSTGCNVFTQITVNANPSAITGTPVVCTGNTTTLSSTPTGGTWSSSITADATVGSTTGIVLGVAAGNPVITYTLPTGCINKVTATVNPTPTTITGTLNVCPGLTTTVNSTPAGGTWTSSNTAEATVAGGVVTGVTAGTPTISYALSTGCFTTAIVTVNPTPAAIGGTPTVCTGLTTTLTDVSAGGSWSSSNIGLATVGSSSGVVTGVGAGTLTITYVLPTGCYNTLTMTVYTTPAAITGVTNVCPGSTTTLSDATGGGAWSSSNIALATVGTSGVVTGVASGVVNITYTLAGGCIAITPVTVNAAPNLSSFIVSTATSPCIGGGSVVTISSSSIGTGTYTVTYNLTGANSATGSTATLTMGSTSGTFNIPSASLGASGSTTVTVTSVTNTIGCSTNLSTGNTATFNVNPLPLVFAVTGGGSYCAGGAGVHVFLSGSTIGVNYQLMLGGTPLGAPVGGTGTALDFGAQTSGGTYTVVATNATTSCTDNMSGSTTITINPLPTAYAITGGGSYCAGGTGVAVGLANSQVGVNYQLYTGGSAVGAPVSGSGIAITFGLQTLAGTYSVVATNTTTGCTNSMGGTAIITINPSPTAITGPLSVCDGLATTLGSTPFGGTWSSSNTAVAAIGSTTGLITGITPGTTVVSYTLSTGCATSVTFTVNPNPATITGTLNVCTGFTTALTDVTGSGTWSSSNTALATIGSTGIVTGVSAGVPTISYVLSTGCMTTTPVTVNTTPGAIAGPNMVCIGASISLTDATPGGTWSSTFVAVAPVNPSTGVVSGTAVGTTTIVYTIPATGCNVGYPVTVNLTPSAITGTVNVCVGSTTALSDVTAGGTWSSSNTAVASVGSTGTVSGVTAGVATISYAMATGCFTTVNVTVNPSPAAITGASTICIGTSTTLGDVTTGGLWSSSNSGLAPVGSTTGIVTGLSSGTLNIIYTLPAGCTSVFPMTVNPNPSPITGVISACVSGSSTLGDPSLGGSWTSSNPSIASVGPVTGIVNGIAAGAVTITYTLSTGCFATTSFTVNPLPASITGITTVCTGLTTTLADATAGGAWSSTFVAVASVGSVTGVVTGNLAGVTTIVYALPTGCTASTPVTVNASPAAITGGPVACVGSTITLTDLSAGGTWTSSNPALASIGSSSGVVNAIATGNPIITYTLSSGCFTTMVLSVNTNPAAITGVTTVCVGSTTSLFDATGSGTWSSSNTTVAAIGSVSGVVTGVLAGTATITYTLPTGCIATQLVTVNPLPSAITGATSVCVSSATTLSDVSSGGTWTSSNVAIATVGSSTGVVAGVSNGVVVITYTLPTGCFTTYVMTVNPLPAAITGTTVVCVNAASILADATAGGSWSSSNSAVGSISIGVITGVSAGTVTYTYTLPTGCIATVAGTVNALPALFTVTGGGAFCAGGIGVHVGLSGSAVGFSYQLFNGGVAMGSPKLGTGLPLDFGLITTAGTFTVVATNSATGCFITMTGSATIVGNPLPTAFAITGGGTYCAGGAGVVVNLAGSQTGISYQLYNGGVATGSAVTGTGAAISFGLQTVAGTYSVIATNITTGCTSGMTGTVVISVSPLPTVYAVTGGGAYCSGTSGLHIGLAGSASGVSYQLFRGGIATGSPLSGTGGPLDFGLFTTAGTYTVVATNTAGCISNMAGSAVISVNPAPAVYTVSGGGSYCAGGAGLNVSLSSSDLGINYQLYNGTSTVGAPVAGTGSGISFGLQTSAGVYTVVATNATTGCTSTMSGSATIVVNPLPTVYTITGGGSYCSGGSGVSIGLGGSQSGVNYQLFVGGSPIGSPVTGTGTAISFGTFTTAGSYTAVATNATTGCTSNMSGSTAISISLPPSVFTITGGGSYCTGGAGVLIGLAGSQSGVSYQLLNGGTPTGAPVAGTGVAISFGMQTVAGTTYTVLATNVSTGCQNTMSGSVAVTINALPTAYAVTGGGSYCAGGTGVTVGLANSQSGVSYQLFLGTSTVGSPVSGTGSAISFGLQTAGGTYTVVATNSTTGCVNNMTGSVTISTVSLPAVYSVTGGGSFCTGGTGLSIGLSGSQLGVNYQLYNSGVSVGSAVPGTGSSFSFGTTFTTAGTYTVIATSGSTTCSDNMLGSAVISVNPLPNAYTVTGGGAYCTGGSGVHVGLANSDPGINYQLYFGGTATGAPVAGTGIALDFGLQTAVGTYTVKATNATTGCVNNMSGSVAVSATTAPTVYNVTGGGSFCAGGTGVAVGLSGSQSGVSYQLYNSGVAVGSPLSGTGAALNFGLQTVGGTYTVVATFTGTGCTIAMSGSATVTVNPLPTVYAVTGGGSFCTGGSGVVVGLTGSQVGVTYQLYRGGIAVGSPLSGTGASISFGLQTITGTYTVTGVSAIVGCTSNMSGSATVSVASAPAAVAVTGGGGYCFGGVGVHVGIAGSAVGINYQLYRGGVAIGTPFAGIGAALDFGLQTVAGTYTVIATDPSSGCTTTMLGSAIVTVNPLPTIYTVTGGGSYCSGGTGVAVGLSNSNTGIHYQLYRSGSPVGSPVAGTGAAITFGLQTVAGTYTVVATNTTTLCTSNMTGSATITINPLPTAYTVTGGGSYCSGGTGVTVGLSGSTVGVSYQLETGGVPVGSPVPGTGSSITFGLHTAAGTYTVLATNTTTGCTATMTGSVTVSVNPLPTAYTVTGGGSFCAGGTGVTVGLSSCDAGVNYQLFRGATAIGSPMTCTGLPINFGLQTVAGTYTVVATNATTGCTKTMTGSVTITINPAPTAYTVSGGGIYCSGAGFHVLLSGSSVGINYQLYLGASPVGGAMAGTGIGLDFGAYSTAGTYTVKATNTTTGCTSNMTGSAVITAGTLPAVFTVTGGGTYCAGGTGFTVGLSGSTGGVTYQLYVGTSLVGTPVSGTGAPISFGLQTIAGGYTVIATNSTSGCTRSMSGSATITVNALPTAYTMTGGGSYCPGGTGVHVGLSGSNTGVNYQLYRGVTAVGSAHSGSGLSIDFGLQTTAGTYTVIATSTSTGCTNNMTGSATVATYTAPSISGTIYTVAPAATITLTGTPSGGTWVSSATAIATIGSGSGIVTGVALGSTTITYTSTTGCTATHTVSVTPTGHRQSSVDSTAGVVISTTGGSNLYVAPNPNHGAFTLKGNLGTTDDQDVSIQITDVLGQVVYSSKITAKNGELEERIQLRGATANGMYLMTVRSVADSKVFHIVVEQ